MTAETARAGQYSTTLTVPAKLKKTGGERPKTF